MGEIDLGWINGRSTAAAAGLVTAALGLWLSAPAHAATASVEAIPSPDPRGFPTVQLNYVADSGEVNTPDISFKFGHTAPDNNSVAHDKEVIISDQGARMIKPGFGCVSLGIKKVVCDSTGSSDPTNPNWSFYWGFNRAVVMLGDGDDVMVYAGPYAPAMTVDGGYGNDVASMPGDSNDTLIGGPGNDRLEGGGGQDLLAGGPGADDLSGGPGSCCTDAVLYGPPYDDLDVPRSISIDDVANDGADGEGDNVHSDIESVTVDSSSANTFIGDDGPNFFQGGTGPDVMYGMGGSDSLAGWFGNDQLDGGPGPDFLSGGPDDDVLMARDGEVDYTLACDLGNDQLTADLIDPASIRCEQDDRG